VTPELVASLWTSVEAAVPPPLWFSGGFKEQGFQFTVRRPMMKLAARWQVSSVQWQLANRSFAVTPGRGLRDVSLVKTFRWSTRISSSLAGSWQYQI